MPTFSTSIAAGSHGLDQLAAAASASPVEPMPLRVLARPQPKSIVGGFTAYNPAAALPTRVVKRILELEFVELAELSTDNDLPQTPGCPVPARLLVTNISQWVEKYSLMAAVLSTCFLEKAAELFAYQATIVRVERNYEGSRWVVYDCQFRQEALT